MRHDDAVTYLHPDLQAWLRPSEVSSDGYSHMLLTEEAGFRDAGVAALHALAQKAHRDAGERFQRLQGLSLDPLNRPQNPRALRYPDSLHTLVLQGYLGELLAGLISENYRPHAREWRVPLFLFRGHLAAHQELERRRQLGGPARPIPGRTGDDALAFAIDDDDAIIAWLWGEAKCSHDHDAGLISAGCEQLSSDIRIPVDLIQLIELLQDSSEPESEMWIASLRELSFSSAPPPRYDMLVYVCGRRPSAKASWISMSRPHDKYTGGRPLQAVEIHLTDLDEVLVGTYPDHVVQRA
jgi:hypothetical protein